MARNRSPKLQNWLLYIYLLFDPPLHFFFNFSCLSSLWIIFLDKITETWKDQETNPSSLWMLPRWWIWWFKITYLLVWQLRLQPMGSIMFTNWEPQNVKKSVVLDVLEASSSTLVLHTRGLAAHLNKKVKMWSILLRTNKCQTLRY